MNNFQTNDDRRALPFSGGFFLFVFISVAALVGTFFAANADFSFQTKLTVFLSIIFIYALVCAGFYVAQRRRTIVLQNAAATIFNDGIEARLLALEEANEFFGASLKPADMFRLAVSRINEIVPFAACALFLVAGDKLKIAFAAGQNAEAFNDIEIGTDKGLAGKILTNPAARIDKNLRLERSAIAPAALKNLDTAIAAPLLREMKVFGVLTLYGKTENSFDDQSLARLEAVAERIAPLFSNSLAFEKNLTNALTDSLTNLPNERAFFMILENQIAESQRFREMRPLTILAIDVVDFDEHNQKFGHAAGDRLLTFAAEKIKAQLRQMDFLARTSGDEFLAVLPTANQEIAAEVIERIRRVFVLESFRPVPTEAVNLALNFGAATFLKDGETAQTLLQTARLQKRQTKHRDGDNILWFPKEFVN